MSEDKIRFGFTHFGSYISPSAKAAESAEIQGQFWAMHELLFSSTNIPDSSIVFNMASKLPLNMDKFKKDYSNKETEVTVFKSLNLIHDAGIYGTPTILINNRPVFNSGSYKEIELEIKKLLNENK